MVVSNRGSSFLVHEEYVAVMSAFSCSNGGNTGPGMGSTCSGVIPGVIPGGFSGYSGLLHPPSCTLKIKIDSKFL